MKQSPAAIFAKIIRRDPDAVARVLAENVQALVGGKVDMQLVPRNGPEFGQLFGGRDLYVFPIEDHHGTPFPSLLAFDLEAAVYSGGAFSLMGPEQIKEVLSSGEIPEILHDSVGEVANIICGAAVHMIRNRVAEAPQFRRGAAFAKKSVGPWPALLAEFGPRVPWEIVACRLAVEGEARGAIFFAASDGLKGRVTKEEIIAVAGPGPEPEPVAADDDEDDIPLVADDEDDADADAAMESAPPAPVPPIARKKQEDKAAKTAGGDAHADGNSSSDGDNDGDSGGDDDDDDGDEDFDAPPKKAFAPAGEAPTNEALDGLRVLVTGHPADPAAAALRSTLEGTGVRVLPAFTAPAQDGAPPDALFVVSRSPVDLRIRLERVPRGRRPPLVVACSDRPTRDLVMAARTAGADDFLVLPTTVERLRGLLGRVPVTA